MPLNFPFPHYFPVAVPPSLKQNLMFSHCSMTTKKTHRTHWAATDELIELPYLLKCKMQFCSLNFVLNCMRYKSQVWSSKPDHTKLDRSIMDHMQPNQALTAKLSHGDKRQKTAQLKLTDTIFLFCSLPIISFVKEAWCITSQLCFRLQAKNHLTWWTH